MNGTRIRRLWPFRTTSPARLLVVTLLLATSTVSPAWAQSAGPGIDDLLNLKRVGSPVVSPDGRSVAYTVRETNWDDNEFETEIWLGTATETRQLTSAPKSSLQPVWSPDGRWLAFVSDRNGRRQLYRLNVGGGEASTALPGLLTGRASSTP
jgi:dipeptidyl aminopeptidase/acylaminoacyl peptidase